MTRPGPRPPVACVPSADWKPRQEPRYHHRAHGTPARPGILVAGRVTRRRSGQAGDPAGFVPSANTYSIRDTCWHRKPRPAPFRRHRPIWTFRWTPRLIQHHACKTIRGRRAGDYQVSLMPVLDVPGLLLICPLTVRRPSRARPRGAQPGARTARPAAEARRGWPGRTWRGRGWPPGRAPRRGGARPGAGTPHGNPIDANCACGRPSERMSGPRLRRGINGALYRIHVRIPPPGKRRTFMNSSRKTVDGRGIPR